MFFAFFGRKHRKVGDAMTIDFSLFCENVVKVPKGTVAFSHFGHKTPKCDHTVL